MLVNKLVYITDIDNLIL